MFDAVVALMLVVDYLRPVQFRDPRRPIILVPYLALFSTSIFLMGIAMFGANRSLPGHSGNECSADQPHDVGMRQGTA